MNWLFSTFPSHVHEGWAWGCAIRHSPANPECRQMSKEAKGSCSIYCDLKLSTGLVEPTCSCLNQFSFSPHSLGNFREQQEGCCLTRGLSKGKGAGLLNSCIYTFPLSPEKIIRGRAIAPWLVWPWRFKELLGAYANLSGLEVLESWYPLWKALLPLAHSVFKPLC